MRPIAGDKVAPERCQVAIEELLRLRKEMLVVLLDATMVKSLA